MTDICVDTERERLMPKKWAERKKGEMREYISLCKVDVLTQLVTASYAKPGASNAEKYTDAELELLIAQIKVAREKAWKQAQDTIEMLSAMLADDTAEEGVEGGQ
jgi:hypothetical protein